MTTPIARLAAYTAAASRCDVTLVDALPDAAAQPGRVELRVADLQAVLAALADACEDHMACEQCGAALCETCGLGTIADCPADAVHCGSAWCWCEACMQAAREDHAVEVAEDLALERCEQS